MELIREFRRAARTLARTPGFALACIVTLAIGIGATTTVFSLVNAILLDPLPYRAADRLVGVSHTAPGLSLAEVGLSDGTYLHYRSHARVFEEIGTYYENVVNLSGDGEAERVPIAMVSHTLFSVLGARTVVGRLPTAEDAGGGGEVVVLISHDLWTRRYGADPGIVGGLIEANRASRRVIGVLEPGFDFPRREIDLWYPSDPDPATARASDLYQNAIARLAPGVDPETAERELNRLIRTLPEAYPDFTPELLRASRLQAVVRPLKEVVVGEASAALWLLLGGMAFLLLIACANVAGLFLVRGEHRQKEIAVRTALGAGRADLARFFAAESLIVGVAGGALALLLAAWGVQVLVAYGPDALPRLHEVAIDGRVGGFALALSIATALLFAFLPLSGRARSSLTTALKERAFGMTATAGRQRVRRGLVTGQVALALALLVAAALMARSFWRLTRVDPGFDAHGVLTADVALPYSGYESYAKNWQLWDALLQRVRALPGVEGAGAVSGLPLVPKPAYYDMAIEVEGRTGEARPALTVYLTWPGYFETMRIPVLQGHGIRPEDPGAERPVLLSAAAARTLFPGEPAVGKRIRRAESRQAPWATVVGVVGDVPKQRIGGDAAAIVYLPVLEEPVDPGLWPGAGTIVMRTSLPPASLAPAVRSILRELDPNLPLANAGTMERIVAGSMARTTFTMLLLIVAALAAVFLGAIGLYGVLSYAVSRRAHEIGIRMALGARAADMRRMLLREGARIALAGVGAGVLVTLALTRFLRALLFEVGPTDPLSFAAAALLLAAVALLATHIPARRATKVDPMIALRSE